MNLVVASSPEQVRDQVGQEWCLAACVIQEASSQNHDSYPLHDSKPYASVSKGGCLSCSAFPLVQLCFRRRHCRDNKRPILPICRHRLWPLVSSIFPFADSLYLLDQEQCARLATLLTHFEGAEFDQSRTPHFGWQLIWRTVKKVTNCSAMIRPHRKKMALKGVKLSCPT
jgi:hypothetical protein